MLELDLAQIAWLMAGVIALFATLYNIRRKRKLRQILLASSRKQKAKQALSNPAQVRQEPAFGALDYDDLLAEPLPGDPSLRAKTTAQDTLIIFHVMAKAPASFMGYQLVQALASVGLQYGNMHIFHRYSDSAHTDEPLFSVLSATEPGTFDLDALGGFSCCGLSFFMNLSKIKQPFAAFELMLETAHQLAEELDGVILDEHREQLTEELIYQYRQRLLHTTAAI